MIIGMSQPPAESKPPEQSDGIVTRLSHGRSLEPLLGPWIGCFVATGLVFLLEYEMPAFHEFVKVFYFVIAVVFIIATARFFRPRGKDRRLNERRMDDRRQDKTRK
jgi:hypothetical protein